MSYMEHLQEVITGIESFKRQRDERYVPFDVKLHQQNLEKWITTVNAGKAFDDAVWHSSRVLQMIPPEMIAEYEAIHAQMYDAQQQFLSMRDRLQELYMP